MKTRSHVASGLLAAALLLLTACNLFVDADKRVERAEQLIEDRNYQAAIIELRNALQSEPEHRQARVMLARLLLQLGDPVASRSELDRIGTDADPELAARIDLETGEHRRLLDEIDSGRLELPEPQKSAYRGLAFAGLARPEEAAEAFAAALKHEHPPIAARIGLADIHTARGELDDAAALLDEVLAEQADNSEALFVLGRLQIRRGDYQEAVRTLARARKNAPAELTLRQHVALLAVLAEAQLVLGDADAADGTREALAKMVPEAPVVRLLAGRIAMARQDYSGAVAQLQRVVNVAPQIPVARFLLGVALFAQGNLNQAEVQLAQVIQQSPENLEARKILAQVRLRLDRPDEAAQVLLPAQQSDGLDVQGSALLSAARLQLGDDAGAVETLQQAAAAHPDDHDLQLNLVAAYLRSGDSKKALQLVNTIAADPADARQEGLLVLSTAAAQGTAAAVAKMEALVAAQPKKASLLAFAGALHSQRGNYDRARTLLKQALEIQPDNETTLLNAARVEVAAGNPSGARGHLQRILTFDSKSVPARLALAELSVTAGDPDGAVKQLNEAHRLDPNAVAPLLMLARVQMQQQNPSAADQAIGTAIDVSSGRADVRNAVGLLYMDAGRFDAALESFRSATQREPGNPGYWINLARAQLALSQSGAARASLGEALRLRADSVAAIGALSMLDLREGRREAAVSRIAELVRKQPHDQGVAVLDGDVKAALGQYAEAEAAYRRAANLRSDTTLVLKMYRMRRLANLPKPLEPVEDWVAFHPDDWTARMVLADGYGAAGQARRAIEQYEVIVRNGRPNAATLNNLAWLYHGIGDERAESTARRAYDLAPGAAAVADTYGWVLLQNGKVEEGTAVLKRAAELAQGDAEIEYHYAVALNESGQKEAARQKLEELSRRPTAFPSQAESRRLLERLSRP